MEAYESDEDREVTLNHNTPKEQQQRYIYINESMQENRKLLKKATDNSRAKKLSTKDTL